MPTRPVATFFSFRRNNGPRFPFLQVFAVPSKKIFLLSALRTVPHLQTEQSSALQNTQEFTLKPSHMTCGTVQYAVPRAKKDLPGCGSASQRGVLIPATTRRRRGQRSSRCLKLAKHRPFSPITDLQKRQISFEFLCESLRTVLNVNKDVTRRVN